MYISSMRPCFVLSSQKDGENRDCKEHTAVFYVPREMQRMLITADIVVALSLQRHLSK